jgi:multimeric flavodoxin WrbA
MKITVLNGSPKGDLSVTMQYVHFIQKKFPDHELKIFNIAQQIKNIEKDGNAFQEIIDEVKSSQGVLWAFPLYVFLVSSQYKRFIELISEKGVKDVFKNRYAAVVTTSIHFFDHTAHNYMRAICDDLEMRYVGAFSADMYDLLKEKEREKLTLFASNVFEAIKNEMLTSKTFRPLNYRTFDYIPRGSEKKIDTMGKKIIILTDSEEDQKNLVKMIDKLRRSFSDHVEVINLNNVDIKGGCLGCIRCGHDNICVYQDKDEFIEFYNTKVKTADALTYAGAIKDRYLSSKWKQFFDRAFFNTHTPSLMGKQIGFIISGPLSQIPNLRQILEAYTEWQQANLVDFITDEYQDSVEIDGLIQSFAERLIQSADERYIKPATFLGVGGMRIFRDDVWGRLRFPFQADHRFYKRHGFYDFPQKDYKARIINRILILLTKIPSMRKEIYANRLKAEMIKPFQKMIEKN